MDDLLKRMPTHGAKRDAMLEVIALIAKANALSNKPLEYMDANDAFDLAGIYRDLADAFRTYAAEITNEKGN